MAFATTPVLTKPLKIHSQTPALTAITGAVFVRSIPHIVASANIMALLSLTSWATLV